MSSEIKVDTISENTSANGVAIDSLGIKDGKITNLMNSTLSAADLGGGVHIKASDSGASANASHDELVIENSGNSGISILSGTSSAGAICFGDSDNNCIAYINASHANNTLEFATNNAERMRIDSDGLVGIGTTSPSPFRLLVDSDSSNNGIAKFNHSDATPEGIRIVYSAAAPDNTTTNFVEIQDSSALRLQILGDGDVKNHDNSYGAISDERIKSNIKDANSQWDDIKALKIRNFERKDDIAAYGEGKKVQIGLIAQECETVSPGLVKEQKPSAGDIKVASEFGTLYEDGDTIPEGKEIGDVKEVKEQVKAISYSVLYMKTIKALQEAMAKIETLEAEVTILKGE